MNRTRLAPRRAVLGLLAVLGVLGVVGARTSAAPADDWDVRTRALEAYRAQDWPLAIERYARSVESNPTDGALWELYGMALLSAGRFEESIPAFERGIAAGVRVPAATYNIACANARAGHVDAALDALERAYEVGFADDALVRTDPDLDSLRGTRRFAAIAGLPGDEALPRDARWLADLDYLDWRLRRLHFDLFGVLPEAEYVSRLEALRASVPARDDVQLRWQVQRLLAAIGDGHTRVVPDFFRERHGGEKVAYDVFPADFWWYEDGLRLRRAPRDQAWAAGARVRSIGGRPVTEALDAALELVSRDNEFGARWMAMTVLRDPQAMRVLGLTDARGALPLELETKGGTRSLVLRAVSHDDPTPLADASDGSSAPLPRYRAHEDEGYRFDLLDDGIAYCLFNAVRDGPAESLAEFAERVFSEAEASDARCLVIDLRNNHGGNGHLARPLLYRAIASRFNRAGALWVLIGRETFSAAQAFAAQLEDHVTVRFAGEPSGSRPNFVGESTIFRLPYSGLLVSCSNRWHQHTSSLDHRLWISPHVYAPVTAEDYAARRDPALDAVRAIVAGMDPAPGPGGAGEHGL
ncbi:MAG: tetratricopeptide repeat protein [Gemmatimonadetes bacterium]|nr:tetratricopeptide repeat protein [Gemmatimonadota bacterium]